MDKRYQVFVSSTFADLEEERRRVIQTLMEMDCIPSSMEFFPALDEEQWKFIKRVIDDCDYYLLIIGGRYGSLTNEGISYTQKEYEYAVEKGLKVVALLHGTPDEISVSKSELDADSRNKLKLFREEVSANRLVRFWKSADELPGLVALNLPKTIKIYPAVGWIRANQSSNNELLNELNEVRKRNDELEKMLAEARQNKPDEILNLASLDELIKIYGTTYRIENAGTSSVRKIEGLWDFNVKWRSLFALIAPYLLEHPNDKHAKSELEKVLYKKARPNSTASGYIDDQIYQTIKIQLQALNLVSVRYSKTTRGSMSLFWSLTPTGHSLMMKLRTVKSKKVEPSSDDGSTQTLT